MENVWVYDMVRHSNNGLSYGYEAQTHDPPPFRLREQWSTPLCPEFTSEDTT